MSRYNNPFDDEEQMQRNLLRTVQIIVFALALLIMIVTGSP